MFTALTLVMVSIPLLCAIVRELYRMLYLHFPEDQTVKFSFEEITKIDIASVVSRREDAQSLIMEMDDFVASANYLLEIDGYQREVRERSAIRLLRAATHENDRLIELALNGHPFRLGEKDCTLKRMEFAASA